MGDQKESNTPDTATGCFLLSRSRLLWKRRLSPLELRTLSAFFILLALLMLLVSVSTDNWLGDGRSAVGLWSACMQPKCAADANRVASGKETIEITRGTLMAAVSCVSFSFLLISISFFKHRIKSFSLGCISAIACFAASIFVMAGMSVYSNELLGDTETMELEVEWSFDAGWASFPLLLLAGSVTLALLFAES